MNYKRVNKADKRQEEVKYLWHGVGSHETEDVLLNTSVEIDHRLQLRGVESGSVFWLNTTLEGLAR